jgi:hypothetical protein
MKFVSLVIIATIFSFGASAQTAADVTEKNTVAKVQQKKKTAKAKASRTKRWAKGGETTTLSDERSYKAKWTFEQMLKRRMEIDAEDGEKKRQLVKE